MEDKFKKNWKDTLLLFTPANILGIQNLLKVIGEIC